jgi:pyruvate kinase
MDPYTDSLNPNPQAQIPGAQIIATLGPASEQPGLWSAMLDAGATGFRLNTSHLSREELEHWLERLNEFLRGRDTQVVLDLQGSKWRLGQFEGREVAVGEQVVLVLGKQALGGGIPVPHADFFAAVSQSNGEVVLNDARVRLGVERSDEERVTGHVTQAGPLLPMKGITLSQSSYRSEQLSEKDQAIYRQTAKLAWVRYAVSYVKDSLEMARYRALLGDRADLIAKLEREPALVDVQGIQEIAGELWLCRGDLGAELGMRRMAEAVHRFSQGLKGVRVPVLLAGQVLEHMVTSQTPTRSEVCTLYDSLAAGYAGVVLSDETAVGRYPVEACTAAKQFSLQ